MIPKHKGICECRSAAPPVQSHSGGVIRAGLRASFRYSRAIDCNAINAQFFKKNARKQALPKTSITISNLDDGLKRRLRVRAAENGRSIEEEARDILRRAVGETPPPRNLGRAIHARFAALGGVDLELPERGPMRPLPDFG